MLPFRIQLRCLLLFLAMSWAPVVQADDDFLEPAQAFKLAVQQAGSDGELMIQFEITAGHYMYGEAFQLTTAQGQVLQLVKPAGVRRFDDTFQKEMETYRGRIQLRSGLPPGAEALLLTGQGCADRGLCYPPIQVQLNRENHGWTFSPVVAPDLTFGRTGFVPVGAKHVQVASVLRLDALVGLFGGLLALFGLWAAASRART